MRMVHLVVFEKGGLMGAYFDEALAHDVAQVDEGGVVVSLPVTSDYRQEGDGDGASAAPA